MKLTSIKSGNLYCGDIVHLLLMLYRINIYLKEFEMSVLSYNYTFTSYLAFAPVVLRYVSEAIEKFNVGLF